MTFLEQRLELGLNFGASYGPRFSTAIATQSDGQEQRRAMWSQPLIVANLAGRAVDKIELDYLLDFHASVKGSAYGFRLRDWSDYQSGLTAIGTGNGTAQTWQLVKRYTIGGYTVTRPITKPVANSLTLYLNGIATATGWSLNTTTGVLTTTLTGAIAVDFEFDVPVRFAEDQIKFTFEAADPFDSARRIFTLDALTCTEIRIEPAIYPAIDPLPTSMPLFNLGYDYGTNGGPQFDTGIAATASEFEARTPYLDSPKGFWNIGDRTLDRAQVDYFLAFYRLCRGMAVPFLFKDWQDETIKPVRFAEDRISLQFNAYRPHDQQVIFYLGGLAIVGNPTISLKLDPTTYVISLFDSSGSMDAVLPNLTAAIADLKILLKQNVYITDEATNKYVKSPISFNSERYLYELTQEYRDNVAEWKKYLFLVFQNEAGSVPPFSTDYHKYPRDLSFEPSTQYDSDFASFQGIYNSFVIFNCLIFVPTSSPAIDYEIAFNAHIIDAVQGNNGYAALSQYGIDVEPDFPIDASATDIYNAIIDYLI